MTVLTSELDPGTAAAQDNRSAMLAAIERIGGLAGQITRGGSEASRARHLARGKLLPRDRVAGLLDAGADFLEIGLFAAHEVYEEPIPAAGVIAWHRQGLRA
jgi:3-methylcrotonyl-CoA carboxylase beta subunit